MRMSIYANEATKRLLSGCGREAAQNPAGANREIGVSRRLDMIADRYLAIRQFETPEGFTWNEWYVLEEVFGRMRMTVDAIRTMEFPLQDAGRFTDLGIRFNVDVLDLFQRVAVLGYASRLAMIEAIEEAHGYRRNGLPINDSLWRAGIRAAS